MGGHLGSTFKGDCEMLVSFPFHFLATMGWMCFLYHFHDEWYAARGPKQQGQSFVDKSIQNSEQK
jgi:hypothetical protein